MSYRGAGKGSKGGKGGKGGKGKGKGSKGSNKGYRRDDDRYQRPSPGPSSNSMDRDEDFRRDRRRRSPSRDITPRPKPREPTPLSPEEQELLERLQLYDQFPPKLCRYMALQEERQFPDLRQQFPNLQIAPNLSHCHFSWMKKDPNDAPLPEIPNQRLKVTLDTTPIPVFDDVGTCDAQGVLHNVYVMMLECNSAETSFQEMSVLVGTRQGEIIPVGGGWNCDLDGADPWDENVLRNTAVRCVKGFCGVDLTSVSLRKMMDITYASPNSVPLKHTVLFLAESWAQTPRITEFIVHNQRHPVKPEEPVVKVPSQHAVSPPQCSERKEEATPMELENETPATSDDPVPTDDPMPPSDPAGEGPTSADDSIAEGKDDHEISMASHASNERRSPSDDIIMEQSNDGHDGSELPPPPADGHETSTDERAEVAAEDGASDHHDEQDVLDSKDTTAENKQAVALQEVYAEQLVKNLRALCKERGLNGNGKKMDLVQRLVEFDLQQASQEKENTTAEDAKVQDAKVQDDSDGAPLAPTDQVEQEAQPPPDVQDVSEVRSAEGEAEPSNTIGALDAEAEGNAQDDDGQRSEVNIAEADGSPAPADTEQEAGEEDRVQSPKAEPAETTPHPTGHVATEGPSGPSLTATPEKVVVPLKSTVSMVTKTMFHLLGNREKEDSKFELALFAEALYEMLHYSHGMLVYKALQDFATEKVRHESPTREKRPLEEDTAPAPKKPKIEVEEDEEAPRIQREVKAEVKEESDPMVLDAGVDDMKAALRAAILATLSVPEKSEEDVAPKEESAGQMEEDGPHNKTEADPKTEEADPKAEEADPKAEEAEPKVEGADPEEGASGHMQEDVEEEGSMVQKEEDPEHKDPEQHEKGDAQDDNMQEDDGPGVGGTKEEVILKRDTEEHFEPEFEGSPEHGREEEASTRVRTNDNQREALTKEHEASPSEHDLVDPEPVADIASAPPVKTENAPFVQSLRNRKKYILGFQFFDTRESGIVRCSDLETILHSLGLGLTAAQVHTLIHIDDLALKHGACNYLTICDP